MTREDLLGWEERIRGAPTDQRMGLVHDFADSLGGNEGKIATSMLRMITMVNDPEAKVHERKSRADGLLFGIGALWILLLAICAGGGIFLAFNDKLSATVVTIGDATINTSSIGGVLVFIAVVGGGVVVVRAIDNLRHD